MVKSKSKSEGKASPVENGASPAGESTPRRLSVTAKGPTARELALAAARRSQSENPDFPPLCPNPQGKQVVDIVYDDIQIPQGDCEEHVNISVDPGLSKTYTMSSHQRARLIQHLKRDEQFHIQSIRDHKTRLRSVRTLIREISPGPAASPVSDFSDESCLSE